MSDDNFNYSRKLQSDPAVNGFLGRWQLWMRKFTLHNSKCFIGYGSLFFRFRIKSSENPAKKRSAAGQFSAFEQDRLYGSSV